MSRQFIAGLASAVLVVSAASSFGGTLAYWDFNSSLDGTGAKVAGTTLTNVPHNVVTTNTYSADIPDVSGNGNDLSMWETGGGAGFAWRTDVPVLNNVVNGTKPNTLSIKNTGGGPASFTEDHNGNHGANGANVLNTGLLSTWTVEASYKPENGGFHTVVGRDAQNVATSDPNLAALYLQKTDDNRWAIKFTDVAGNFWVAQTAAGVVNGYNFPTDNEGLLGTWYNLAGEFDGSTLKLYVDNVLAASTPVSSTDSRLAVGTTTGGDWMNGGWSIGRGLYNGGHGDRAYGFIDEVRISDSALAPSQLLSAPAPEPTSVAALGLAGLFLRRRRA